MSLYSASVDSAIIESERGYSYIRYIATDWLVPCLGLVFPELIVADDKAYAKFVFGRFLSGLDD